MIYALNVAVRKYNPYKWHFITGRQTPRWIVNKFGFKADNYHSNTIEETVMYARGNHYEYKLVVTVGEHTHDNAIIRRKLRH